MKNNTITTNYVDLSMPIFVGWNEAVGDRRQSFLRRIFSTFNNVCTYPELYRIVLVPIPSNWHKLSLRVC